MPMPKGFKHSEESRAKMSLARQGKPHSEDRKAKISASNKGKKRTLVMEKRCHCGVIFQTTAPNAKFHSQICKRSSVGHGIKHSAQFSFFAQVCEICSKTEELVGDHDHSSGAARGILCRSCNLALGNMHDKPDRLRAAADYLEKAKKRRRVFISGPMTGYPDLNYPAFHAEAKRLRSMGLSVESPAENYQPRGTSWEKYMKLSIKQLLRSHSVVLLPGWETSKGATLERHIAQALGMKIMQASEA